MKTNPTRHRTPRIGLLAPLLIATLILVGGLNSAAAPPAQTGAPFEARPLPPEALSWGGSPAVSAQASRSPKLDSSLDGLAAAAQDSPQTALALALSRSLKLSGDRVQVQIVTHAAGLQRAIQAVAESGGEVTKIGSDAALIQGWLPVTALEAVAAHDDIYRIHRPAELIYLEHPQAGSVTTEGLAALNGPAWHTAGYRGAGVKIGIIDGGFLGYTGLLGTDLPASVTAKNFVDGETDGQVDGTSKHGTACVEIIYDVAPDATFYLAKIATNLDLQAAVAWLKDTHHVDVISTSIGWYHLTPGDGTGEFADLVQDARDAGILWATAAGSVREAHWGGLYYDPGGTDTHHYNLEQDVNYFGPGDGNAYLIPAGYPVTVLLRWDDWTVVNQDYDLFLLRWNGESWDIVAESSQVQDGSPGQTPTEDVSIVASGASAPYGFVIVRYDSDRAVNFEVFAPNPGARLDEILPARSLANLADAPDVVSVAAVDVVSPYPQEVFSSEGPTNGPGGAETGGFIKPDIAAYSSVSTVSYGTTDKFSGTSAAAPHVAGAAALVLNAYPAYTPNQVESFLEGRAVDMGASGMDTIYGYGRLHLGAPPSATTTTPSPSPTPTGTVTRTATPTVTRTPTPTITRTPTARLLFLPLVLKSGLCDIYEPNDSIAAAWGPLISGQDYRARLCKGDYEDNYYLNALHTQPLVVRIRLPAALVNHTDAWIYHESNLKTPLPGCGRGPITSTDETVSCAITLDGRYTIRLYTHDSNVYYENNQDYILTATFAPQGGTPVSRTLLSVGDATVLEGYSGFNTGTAADMWAGYDDGMEPDGKIVRSLIKFDLSSVPAGATVQSAKLRVYYMGYYDFSNRERTITAYRCVGNWTELGVNWNNKPSPGTAYGSVVIISNTNWGWRELDVQGLVQGWVNGSIPNQGVMLRGPEVSGADSSYRTFSTREGPNAPQLAITYLAVAAASPPPTMQAPVPAGPSLREQLGSPSAPTDADGREQQMSR